MFESLDEIRTFVRVVDSKSLSAAARDLRVSVNAVWRRMERIEERAGIRLVERTTRALRVTEEGQRVVRHARRILDELQSAARDAAPTKGLTGVVRVAVSADVASGPFLAELDELLQNNPHLRVELIGRSRLLEPVAAGVDIMVWPGPVPTMASTVRKIGTMEWSFAASPSYVARRGAPLTPSDLARHECLLAYRGKKETTWRLTDTEGNIEEVAVNGRLESDTTEVLTSALHLGMGIGIRPRREVLDANRAGELVHILPQWVLSPMEVSLVTPVGSLRLPHVRAVADILTRRLRALANAD